MSRARDLSKLANPAVFSVDTSNNVGLNSTSPDAKLDVIGIVSATAFYGDGSNLEGVASAGLGTALGEDDALSVIYYTDNVLTVGSTITVNPPDSTNVAYTQYAEIAVSGDADLIVAPGDDLVPDILGLSTEGVTPIGGSGGRIRADNFTNHAGTGAPTFQTGVRVTGVATATSFDGDVTGNVTGTAATFTGNVSVGGTLTYQDVTNVDSVGMITARKGIQVLADGINAVGIVTSSEIDVKAAVETVSVGSTYDLGGGKVILECDATNGTAFTHNLTNGSVGIVSIRNFPVRGNSVTTYSIIFTQNATGTANTTPATGIGTNITLTPSGVAGFTTTSRVATASTVTLSTTANDDDIVTLAIHYNGSGTGDVGNYKVYATNNSGYRFGTIGF